MSEQKPLTAYGLAFVALRLFAIFIAYNLLGSLSQLLRVLSPAYSDQFTGLIAVVPWILLQFIFLFVAWFGAPVVARRLSPPVELNHDLEIPPSIRSWQNLFLTLLGFYLLYRLGMDIAQEAATYVDRPPTIREFIQAAVGVRLIAGLILILAPNLISEGLENLRKIVSSKRGLS